MGKLKHKDAVLLDTILTTAFIFLSADGSHLKTVDVSFYHSAKTVSTVHIKVCVVFELLKYAILSDFKQS